MSEQRFTHSAEQGRGRQLRAHPAGWLVCVAIALAVVGAGGFEAPLASLQIDSAIGGCEAEEIVTEARRTQAGRRIAEPRPLGLAKLAHVAPGDLDAALAAHASAPVGRDTGRRRRHRHQSLLI